MTVHPCSLEDQARRAMCSDEERERRAPTLLDRIKAFFAGLFLIGCAIVFLSIWPD